MPSAESTIVNKLGLHARAAAKLTHLAGSYKSEIWLSRSGRRVNEKSIMGVVMLAAVQGSSVLIEAAGADAEQAIAALTTLIADQSGDGERTSFCTVISSRAGAPWAARTSCRPRA